MSSSDDDRRRALERAAMMAGISSSDIQRKMEEYVAKNVEPFGMAMGGISVSFGVQEPPRRDDAQYALRRAEEIIRQQQAQLESLQGQPQPIASIVRIAPDRQTCVIAMGGQQLVVKLPAANAFLGAKDLAAGSSVRLAPTGQIMGAADGPLATGEACSVRRVIDDHTIEIEWNSGTRAVAFGGTPPKPGDRVLVDPGWNVVTKVLPRSSSTFAFTRETGVSWDDIGGLDDAKSQLVEAVETPHKHKDLFVRYGKRPVRGVLLYGPPGCGKTMIAKATATALARVHGAAGTHGFLYVKGPEILSQWVGASEAKIREIFAATRAFYAEHGFPAVLFIDECEAILGARDTRSALGGAGMERTIVPQFLAEMDGLEESGAMVLLATNRPQALDPAIVRDGRIDRKVRIGRPTGAEAVTIFAQYLKKRPCGADGYVSLAGAGARALFSDELALYKLVTKEAGTFHMTLGHMSSGAMIAGIVERAATAAMMRDVNGSAGGALDCSGIGVEDLQAAVRASFVETIDTNHGEAVQDFVHEHRKHELVSMERVRHADA